MTSPRVGLLSAALVLLAGLASPAFPQGRITTPKEALGANFGDDYFLATYRQISDYWRKLDQESDRMVLQEMGKTAEGRTQLMAIVSSPANLTNLARYKEIASRLAHAEGVSDDEARALAREGKAIVWIDGGLHATETLGAQQLGEMVYQMVSRTDAETMRFLDDVVVLFVHANPDGNDLVADWYMRQSDPARRSLNQLPRLYQKYIGHDNNRDFFASTQAETENINRALYTEWYPQILYNHHQSGPAGTVVYSPPFRDPYNFNLDPVLLLGLQSLGAAMHTRLAVENKGGATMRSGGPYDGWWNGGIRNTATFHNTIAMLTEMIGSPTPMRIPFVAQRQIPSGDIALPIAPQEWHFRQSVDYSISLDRAVIDYASRMRENLLYNIYVMGQHSIERGSQDTWTANPRRIAAVAGTAPAAGGGGANPAADPGRDSTTWAALHATAIRDPRGYIIPSDQVDFPTAVTFVNALLETGITVQRATAPFTAGGASYPAGSFVVMAAQAFRPHVMDMFEPQVHPDVFPYPGASPTPPYDNAGWTLAFQMGIRFDRVLDGFTGPFEKVTAWNLPAPPARVTGDKGAGGYLFSNQVNNAFIAVNRLLSAKQEVFRTPAALTADGIAYPAGSFYVRATPVSKLEVEKAAGNLGVSFDGTRTKAAPGFAAVTAKRVGLWDRYGGSIESGWTRWILEQFEFPFERVFAPQLDAGNLNTSFDVLVFVDGAFPGGDAGPPRGNANAEAPADLPAEYAGQFGSVSAQTTVPQLKAFLEGGGSIVAIGSSATVLAAQLGLPLESQLTETGAPLPRTKFYLPGSIVSVRVDSTLALGRGMPGHADLFFDNSPVFRLKTGVNTAGVTPLAWFDSAAPLRSGWAWGQKYLEHGLAAVDARVGKGRVVLFGPEILQRAQPHGTFKFLFNAILEGSGPAVPLARR